VQATAETTTYTQKTAQKTGAPVVNSRTLHTSGKCCKARKIEKEDGVKFEFVIKDGQRNLQTQLQQFDQLIAQKNVDIIYSGKRGNECHIYYRFGNGDGSFQTEQYIPDGYGLTNGNFILVDMDGDGDLDLVTSGNKTDKPRLYKWNGSSWVEIKLSAPDGAVDDRFGDSVAISGDGNTAIIGSYWDDDSGSRSGSMYVVKL